MFENLKKLSDLAQASGFKLMETSWLGDLSNHRFIDLKTNEPYFGMPKDLFGKPGFPKSVKTNKDRFRDLSAYAKLHGFTLLDHEWMGSDVKHNFQHDETKMTYSWLAHQVMGSQGFPKDLKSNEDRFKKLSDFSSKKGFKLVSERWMGSKTKHQFIHIKTGESYEATPVKVMGADGFPNDMINCLEVSGLNDEQHLASKKKTKGFKLLEQQWMASFLLLGSTFSSASIDDEEPEGLKEEHLEIA